MFDENRTKNLVDPDSLAIVSSGTPTVQKKEEFETIFHDAGSGLSTSELYDRYMKLIYVVDNSQSMSEGMAMSDSVERYEWTAENLAAARLAMAEYLKKFKVEQLEDADIEDMPEDEPLFDSIPDNDEELKRLIVQADLNDEFELKIPMKRYGGFGASRSKIESVKAAAKKFVEQRFTKYPEANVMLFGFDAEAYILGRGISKEEVLNAIDSLDARGGDTKIVPAVRTSVSECRKRPSEVGAHHVVLVTDGYDNYSGLMTEALPQLLEMHIVLDFIFVKGQSDTDVYGMYNEKISAIKEVCAKTGGEYTEVSTVEDFEQKFLAASNRPMLPWK